jgi:hypothetical protein
MNESQSEFEHVAKLTTKVCTGHMAATGSAFARPMSRPRISEYWQEFSAGFLPLLVHTFLTRPVDIVETDVQGGAAVRFHGAAGLAERLRDSLEREIDSSRPVVWLGLTTRGAVSANFSNRLATIHVGGELF